MAYLNDAQLAAIGLRSYGKKVYISDKASIYNPGAINIGDNVRIDDFVVISAGEGGIKIGSNIHIAIFSSLIGQGQIELKDFCNISSRVSVYSSSDDYSGNSLTNPTIPNKFKKVVNAPVTVEEHVIIGAGSVVLPGVTVGKGCAVGSLSLVNVSLEPFTIYAGVPVKRIKERSKVILELEKQYLSEASND